MARLPYDPIKDFAPIILVGALPHVLVVHPSLAATKVKELVSLVRDNPGKYRYESPGTAQSGQLAGEMFRLEYELDHACAIQRRRASHHVDVGHDHAPAAAGVEQATEPKSQ